MSASYGVKRGASRRSKTDGNSALVRRTQWSTGHSPPPNLAAISDAMAADYLLSEERPRNTNLGCDRLYRRTAQIILRGYFQPTIDPPAFNEPRQSVSIKTHRKRSETCAVGFEKVIHCNDSTCFVPSLLSLGLESPQACDTSCNQIRMV
jgi:hypothetical protein